MGTAAAVAFQTEEDYIISFAGIQVNLDRGTVIRNGGRVTFSPTEFELLTYFLQNPDRTLTRDMILDSVWTALASPNTRTVDAHVLRLRHKLEPQPANPRYFLTIHKIGYRFSPQNL